MAQEFVAKLRKIFTGALGGPVSRWSACGFFNKVLFATSSVVPQVWTGGGPTRPMPGLPDSRGWDGVEVLSGHVVLWRGNTLKFSSVNDHTTWIPVSQTAAPVRAKTTTDFERPATGTTTGVIHFDAVDGTLVEGQFVRVDSFGEDPEKETVDFFEVVSTSDPLSTKTRTISESQVLAAKGTGQIFTSTFAGWKTGTRLVILDKIPVPVEVTADEVKIDRTYKAIDQVGPLPALGGVLTVRLESSSEGLKVGSAVSFGAVGADIYIVKALSGYTISLSPLRIGSSISIEGTVLPSGLVLVPQPSITVTNPADFPVSFPGLTNVAAIASATLRSLGYTGGSDAGTMIGKGTPIQSVDANDSGEIINVGSEINGDIFAVVSLGEYGVILKENSIQSIQSVGRQSGTFFIRPEVLGEGLIARNAWIRIGGNSIIFCGKDDVFQYSGGSAVTPVGRQHSPQVFDELDRSRADLITIYDNHPQNEAWMVYPTLAGEWKVFVYNYSIGSSAVDVYPGTLGGITAVGGVDWEVGPTWNSLSRALVWTAETLRWYEYVDIGQQRYTLIGVAADSAPGPEPGTAASVPRLLAHGRVTSRASGSNCDPMPMRCFAETQDYDFGNAAAWKYIDTVIINAEVKTTSTESRKMFVEVGARDNLDAPVRWTDPVPVEVSGLGSGVRATKANVRSSGRFIRVRFSSNAIGVEWRIAGFSLIGRLGGTY